MRLLTALLLGVSGVILAAGVKEEISWTALEEAVRQEGYIRVLVQLEVPGLEHGSRQSRHAASGIPGRERLVAVLAADENLRRTILPVRESFLEQMKGAVLRLNQVYDTVPWVALTLERDGLKRLRTAAGVVGVFRDRLCALPDESDGVSRSVDRAGDVPLPIMQVGADWCWSYGYAGRGWCVAVLDTGIRRTHELFEGRVWEEQCFATGEDYLDESTGGCPNGLKEDSGVGAARHYRDRDDHGSHVSGIAMGRQGYTPLGVAPEAGLLAVNVFSYFSD